MNNYKKKIEGIVTTMGLRTVRIVIHMIVTGLVDAVNTVVHTKVDSVQDVNQ
jgi:hypothetical protein